MGRPFLFHIVTTSALTLVLPYSALALPQGGVVAGGNASIAASGPQLSVTQGSARAVIDWQKFNVGSGEKVDIRQPSTSSILLNRIHDQQPSQIFGAISANGRVVLSNPNGMIFGPGSKVDVAGLIATTAGIDTTSFMAKPQLNFSQPGNANARILNQGSITAKDGGLVALVAPTVSNEGVITARAGRVTLGGADMLTLDLYGDGLVAVAASPQQRHALVEQNGTIEAESGAVALTAAQGAQLVNSAVNMDGIVEASGLVLSNGAAETAGSVTVTGDEITLQPDTQIHADGPLGGGLIRIGGDYQGGGTLPWAKVVSVGVGSIITADAKDVGKGGKVVLWSNDLTAMEGTIHAKGGSRGGDGGLVETSSHGNLDVQGNVDASAPRGANGEWLLDPRNVTIQDGSGVAIPAGGGTIAAPSNNYSINASSISTALTGGNNVKITTGGAGAQAGNMTVTNATISKTGGGNATLTLEAQKNIDISGSSITSNTGQLNVILWSHDTNAAAGGYIRLNASTVTTNGGFLHMAGGLDDGSNGGAAGDGRPDGFALSTTNGFGGIEISTATITTSGGSVLMQGDTTATNVGGNSGIGINDLSLNTGAGSITLLGADHGGGGCCSNGVFITGSDFTTSGGTIKITGTGAANGDYAEGIQIENGTTITATGTASILMNGTGGSGTGQGKDGLLIRNSGTVISSTGSGTITINGTGGNGTDSNNGIELDNWAQITSVTGAISLLGKGNGSGHDNNGISVKGGSSVTSTGTGATAATITSSGTGGNGTYNNRGILLSDGWTLITSNKGAVSLTGLGNGGGDGNSGIELAVGAQITSTGVGAAVGAITLSGTGAAGYAANSGISVHDTNSAISAVDGALTLNGTGGAGSGYSNTGIGLALAGSVSTTGSTGGTITLNGQAGTGFTNINGIDLYFYPSITSNHGDIVINGTADASAPGNGFSLNVATVDSSSGNITINGIEGAAATGIAVYGGSTVGDSSMTGTITLNTNTIYLASASIATQNDILVTPRTAATSISINGSGGGTLNLDATALGTLHADADHDYSGRLVIGDSVAGSGAVDIGAWNLAGETFDVEVHGGTIDFGGAITWDRGIDLLFNARTGSILNAPTFTKSGTGDSTLTLKAAGDIALTNASLTSSSGKLNTVLWSDSDANNSGAIKLLNATVTTNGGYFHAAGGLDTGANGGTASDGRPDGFARGNGANKDGVYIGNTAIVTGAGDVLLRGQGEDGTDTAHGIDLQFSDSITTTGGVITMVGSAGSGSFGNWGVNVNGSDLTSQTGGIAITGISSAGTQDHNWGVGITSSTVSSTGTGASAANITISGTGGTGTTDIDGVALYGDTFSTIDGDILVTGVGGTDFWYVARGIVSGASSFTSTGTTASAGTITFNGTGGGGSCCHAGILIEGGDTITSAYGAIALNGTAGNSGVYDSGIVINNGSSITSTGTGATAATITVHGTGGASVPMNGITISDSGTLISSVDGAITLVGTGGGGGADGYGIQLTNAAKITSTGTGATAATITLSGTGGNGTDSNVGVYIDGDGTPGNTAITTVDGAVSLTGIGRGTASNDSGILIDNASRIASTGTGTIGLSGTGASGGTVGGHGVVVDNSTITSVQGAIGLTGLGRGSGNNNEGVVVKNGGTVSSTGTGATAAGITLIGTGASGAADYEYGIQLVDSSTLITSVDGDILLTGIGGSSASGDTGIDISAGAKIISTGAAGSGAKITLDGTGGNSTGSSSAGISLNDSGTLIASVEGDILLKGTAHGAGGGGQGIGVNGGVELRSTGTGAAAANITLSGKGSTTGTSFGAGIGYSSSSIHTVDGDVSLTGIAGGNGSYDTGVYLNSGSAITSTGTGASAGKVTLSGTAANGVAENYGVYLADGGTAITSVDGNIALAGIGAGSGVNNGGIIVKDGATLTSTGTGATAASITVTGTGGAGDTNHGVFVDGGGILTVDGDVALSGTGGAGDGSHGVDVAGFALIQSTGTTSGAGTLTFTGTGGGGNHSDGVLVTGSGTLIDSNSGAITFNGTGGASGIIGVGVELYDDATVSSSGFGNDAATITLHGTGGAGTDYNSGIIIYGTNTALWSFDGNILLDGQGAGTGLYNIGINVRNGSEVSSRGATSNAATLTLTGTGGNGTDGNLGLIIADSGTLVTSTNGTIAATGYGRGTGTSNAGTVVNLGATVSSTGTGASAATITLDGTSGNGTSNNSGVALSGGTTLITSMDGDIALTGYGRGTTDNNYGVELYSAQVTSTGTGASAASITLTGTGGGGGGNNMGVIQYYGSTVSSNAGDITVTGTGNISGTATGSYNNGIQMDGSDRLSTVSGAIALTGIGHGFGGLNYGIAIEGMVTSTSTGTVGGITLNGTGSTDGGTGSTGISLNGTLTSVGADITATGIGGLAGNGLYIANGLITSTGEGDVTLSGTAGAGTTFSGGIELNNGDVHVTNGDLLMNGTGNAVAWGYGTNIWNGSTITSTGTGVGAGTITINGTGAASGTGQDHGIRLSDSGTLITSIDGAIALNGTGAGTGSGNNGILLQSSATINSTGTGIAPATITLTGTGSAGTNDNKGIYLTDSGTLVTSVSGAVSLTGRGGGSGDRNRGVNLANGAQITSTGSGAGIGAIALSGTGGNGGSYNMGILLEDSGSGIRTADSNVTLTGTGNGSSWQNGGVTLSNGASVTTTGNIGGAVTLTGTGSANPASGNDDGVALISGSSVLTHHGDIILTGHGNDTNSSEGISLAANDTIASDSGSVTLNAYAGGPARTGFFSGGGGDAVGSASMTGAITINADSIDWSAINVSTQNDITIKPIDPTTTIGLAGAAGTLNLTAAELGMLHADVDANATGELIFGEWNTGSGDIHVGAYSGWNSKIRFYDASGQIYFDGVQDFGWAHGMTIGTNADIHLNADIVQAPFVHVFGMDGTSTVALGGAAGPINLSDADLDHLASVGWFGIGGTWSSNPVVMDAYAGWKPGTVDIGSTSSITVNGLQSAAAGATPNFDFNGPTSMTAGIDLSTAAGNPYIHFHDTLTLTGDTALTSHGTGAVTFDGTVNGAHDLSVTGGALTFSGAVGGSTALTNLTLKTDTSISAAAAINATNHITIAPITASTSIGLAGGAGTLQVNAATLGRLHADSDVNGSGALVIGNANSTNDIHLNAYNGWNSNVTLRSDTGQIYFDGVQDFHSRALRLETQGDPHVGFDLNNIGAFILADYSATGFSVGDATSAHNLDTAELDHIKSAYDGFYLNGGDLKLAAYNWHESAVFVDFSGTHTITVAGNQTAAAGSTTSLEFGGSTILNANIDLNAASGNQQILFHNAVTLGADVSLRAANAGAVTFDSTVNGAHDLTVTGGALTFGAAVGGSTALTNLTLNTDTSISAAANINATNNITIAPITNSTSIGLAGGAGTLQVNATTLGRLHADSDASGGGGLFIGKTTGTGDMHIGAFSGWNSSLITYTDSGQIYIDGAQDFGNRGYSIGTNADIHVNADIDHASMQISGLDGTTTIATGGATGTINLSDAELDHLHYLNRLNLGNAGSSNPIVMDAYNNWTASTIEVGSSGSVTVNGVQASASGANGNFDFDTATSMTGGIDLSASAGNPYIHFHDTLTLTGDTALATHGTGAVTFDGTIDGAHDLTVTGGAITFGGVVGGSTPLSILNLNTDTSVTATADIHADDNINIAPITNSTSIGLAGAAGTLQVDAATLGHMHADADANGLGLLNIGVSYSTGDMHLNAYSGWNSGVTLLSGTGQIYIDGAQDFGWQHALRIGTNADLHINADLSQMTALHIFGTDGTTSIGVGGAAGTINLSDAELDHIISAGWLGIGWQGTGNPVTMDAYNNWHATDVVIGSSGSINVNGLQQSTAGSATSFTFDNAVSMTAGVDLSADAGNHSVTFHGPVTLTGDSTVRAAGTGAITFDDTVDGAHDLDVQTAGDILFSGAVGGVTRLGDVTVDPAHFTSTAGFRAASFTLTGGTNAVAFNGTGLNTTGNISIDTDGNITGSYLGTGGHLYAGTGAVNAGVTFGTLDINGASANLTAGNIGAVGPATQTMANLITVGGLTGPGTANYRFAGFNIGLLMAPPPPPPPPPSGGGSSTPPVVTPPTNNGGGTVTPPVTTPAGPGTPGVITPAIVAQSNSVSLERAIRFQTDTAATPAMATSEDASSADSSGSQWMMDSDNFSSLNDESPEAGTVTTAFSGDDKDGRRYQSNHILLSFTKAMLRLLQAR